MKKFFWIIFVLIAALLLGIYFYNPDRNLIDEHYISTGEFQSLEKQLDRHAPNGESPTFSLKIIARKTLESPKTNELKIPFALDSTSFKGYVNPEHKLRLKKTAQSRSEFENFDFYAVGRSSGNGVTFVLFLMKKLSVYRDIEVILTTVKDSSVIDIASVARFRKNISEEITSTLKIEKDLVLKTKVSKIRLYPVRQENVVHYQYGISEKGGIAEKLMSGD